MHTIHTYEEIEGIQNNIVENEAGLISQVWQQNQDKQNKLVCFLGVGIGGFWADSDPKLSHSPNCRVKN
jgi:hypothetical protein